MLAKESLREIPRLLSMLDRNEISPTRGCFDRSYWQYKDVSFANSLMQEGILALALLYTKKGIPGNIYYRSRRIRQWYNYALEYWATIQKKDGSFDEAYHNEYSYPATAFSLHSVTEALFLIPNENALEYVRKAADWLLENDEPALISNHKAGAACALYNTYLLTEDEKYKDGCEAILEEIVSNQSSEGWFPEYGGPDIGYQSLTISYLANYYKRSKDKAVLAPLEKAIEFFSYFMHPNGSSGGEYASRNTAFLYPYGFAALASKIPLADSIIRSYLSSGSTVTPASMDYRYMIPLLNSYLTASLISQKRVRTPALPWESEMEKYFPESRLFVKSTRLYYAIVGCEKGGITYVYSKRPKKLLFVDCGYSGTLGKKIITSSWPDSDYIVEYNKGELEITGDVHAFRPHYSNPLKSLFLHSFMLTFGMSKAISHAFKGFLIKNLITEARTIDNQFTRRISFTEDKITIEDSIGHAEEFDELYLGGKSSLRYVSAAKYYTSQELGSLSEIETAKERNKRVFDIRKMTRRP